METDVCFWCGDLLLLYFQSDTNEKTPFSYRFEIPPLFKMLNFPTYKDLLMNFVLYS